MCCHLLSKGVKMDTKNVTLKVNSNLYDQYREYCKQKEWVVSRQFEILMENHLKKEVKNV